MTDRAVSLRNPTGSSSMVLVCEHASAHIPERYNNLGLDAQAMQSHIAWDPGASTTANHLSKLLDAVLIESEVSRLVYDCNRPPESAGAMPVQSEIYTIPGNKNLSDTERQKRIDTCYRPFVATVSEALANHPGTPVLVTIHSFTPVYNGIRREVEIGVLHDNDTRLADAMLDLVPPTLCDFNIERNEPYGAGDGVTHTLKQHGIKNNLLNVMLEIRNDLVQTEEQCMTIAQGLEQWLSAALNTLDGNHSSAELQS